ncbi:MAG TPA: c-type cytochrome [Mucilaginibacter sp.]|jgi:cytochrome c
MMMKRSKLVYLFFISVLFLFTLVNFANPIKVKYPQSENHPPVVKIILPKNNDVFNFNAQANYEISVADQEDGNSKYDEINAKEVLLEVKYTVLKSKTSPPGTNTVPTDPSGLAMMRVSNCFNCHNFNSKSIGPSFYEISKRYPLTPAKTDSLIKHIHEGSSDIWGKEKMPSHPELTKEEIKSAVQWIMKQGAKADVSYYTGLQGSFHISPPIAAKQNGIYVLTASYVDHGLKSEPGKQRSRGQDVVVIYGK